MSKTFRRQSTKYLDEDDMEFHTRRSERKKQKLLDREQKKTMKQLSRELQDDTKEE